MATLQLNPQLSVCIICIYCLPFKDFNEDLDALQAVIDSNVNNFIICGDFNARSEIWFGTRTNRKGKQLEEFVLANDVYISNEPGFLPTFETINGISCVDITDGTTKNLIKEWRVIEELTSSDHRVINFTLSSNGTTDSTIERKKEPRRIIGEITETTGQEV